MKKEVAKTEGNALTKEERIEEGRKKLARWINSDQVKQRFNDVLKEQANGFISSVIALCNEIPALLEIADPTTIIAAALQAATLKLPINKNLGFAYIVPYKAKNGVSAAQFQMGWRGYVQLAERTGQYRTIHAGVVYEGQVKDIDFITGQIIRGEKISDNVIGYVAYIEMVNGFSKTLYMTKDEMTAHAKKYSQSYSYDLSKGYRNSPWSTNFDAMANKTVLKLLIGKYGIMSVDMESANISQALAADGASIDSNGNYDYIDNRTVDAVAREVEDNTGSQVLGDEEPPMDTQYAESKADTEMAAKAEEPVTDANALEGMSF